MPEPFESGARAGTDIEHLLQPQADGVNEALLAALTLLLDAPGVARRASGGRTTLLSGGYESVVRCAHDAPLRRQGQNTR
jgi:hypothetical protein